MVIHRAWLTLKRQKSVQHILLLAGEDVKFGRDTANDVRLLLWPIEDPVLQVASADISRQHFKICWQNQQYMIQDLHSTNGTCLNCIALAEQAIPLLDKQIIDIGGVLDIQVRLYSTAVCLSRISNLSQESYIIFQREVTIGNRETSMIAIQPSNSHILEIAISVEHDEWMISNQGTIAVEVAQSLLAPGCKISVVEETDIILSNELMLFQIEKEQAP